MGQLGHSSCLELLYVPIESGVHSVKKDNCFLVGDNNQHEDIFKILFVLLNKSSDLRLFVIKMMIGSPWRATAHPLKSYSRELTWTSVS